ncbi:MAG: type I polyketide synthase, partial [Trebonia sp.]
MSALEHVSAPASPRIAIIGMAGRFPGAGGIDEFWQNLINGVESLTELEPDRLREAGVSESHIANPNHVPLVPLMDDIEGFDARYFGYHAREAQIADPQQRIFLEVCHTALEHAGYDPDRYPGRIGVYGGGAPNTYSEQYVYSNEKARAAVGDLAIEINNASDYVATRVAFALGLSGPAVSVTTACSTALVAVHLACRALAGGECTMALAGAVNVRAPYYKGHLWAENSIYSRDGHVRAFDADASGTNFGYGAGTFVLKRLEDAVADGDTVHAVIIGSAINNDGAKRPSFSAPSSVGQAAVIAQALRAAGGISPDSIGYVEAHGTGTAVGDPIEIAALTAAYRQAGGTASQSIPVGSVKSNIGHLGAAAGVPGLIKTVLAMRHRRLPATLHYKKPNPLIDFAETPFHVNKGARYWPKTGGPMRAGVSSFGIGGTNAHVIVEEPPAPEPTDPGRPWQILPLSAKSATALEAMGPRLIEHLKANPDVRLADVAYTLQVGRPQLAHRAFAVCRDDQSALATLTISDGVRVKPRQHTPTVFMFPGQGAQHVDMAAELYRTEADFRDAIDECARLAEPHLGCDLRDVVFSSRSPGAGAEELAIRLRRTEFAQPALFAVEYALARLWMNWGVEPTAMVGHSIGEIVAACLAEVFSLRAAIEFVVTRGRLTQAMTAGSMLALPLAESEVELVLTDEISLAAINAPRATVVAGPHDAISALTGMLERTGVQGTLLRTSHAFHSAMLDPVVAPLREAAEGAGLKPPTRRFVSTVTGGWITDEQATDPGYWAAQVRRPVRFAEAVLTAAKTGAVLLEVGPGRSLTSLAKQTLGKAANVIASLGRGGADAGSDGQSLAQATGQLWASGVAVDWVALSQEQRRQRVPLLAYPYERTRFWVETEPAAQPETAQPETAQAGALGAGTSDAVGNLTYLPVWRQRRLPPPAADEADGGPLLVFTRGDGPVEAAAAEWAEHGRAVVRVLAGDGFADLGDGSFQVAPASRGDYDKLVSALDAGVGRPTVVLHGWTATPACAAALVTEAVHAVRDAGFFSLMFLTQAYATHWPGAEVALRIVTTHGANVSGAEAVEPAKALLHGPCKVMPIELNQIACQLIDLSPTTGADQLLRELAAPIADQTVAYRGNRRWVADYERTPTLAEPVAMPRGLRRRGVYLVTGGLGDIGLRVARHLAASVGARLILTGRRHLPERADWEDYLAANGQDWVSANIRAIRELESLGSEVLPISVDVADERAMRMALDAAVERFGRIDGVFHAAGVAGAGVVAMKSRDQAESVLRPKVDGTLVLDRLLGSDVDLLVLFSSIFAVTGMYGQVDYCAANAFMDAFAQARAGGRMQILSVDWCGWSGVGMLAEDPFAQAEAGTPPVSASGDTEDGAEPVSSEIRLGDKAPGLLGRRVLDGDDVVFSAVVGPDWHWVLTDHQIAGRQVFPGTSYAEMIAAAAREVFGGGAVEVRDLIFSRLLTIDGPREMRVTGTQQGSDTYQFTVTSRPVGAADALWERHAGATATAYHGDEPPWQDVAAIAKRCDLLHWKPDPTRPGSVVVCGPHWQVVQSVALGRGEQLARLELPVGLDTDVADYSLHPSLLDGATAMSLYIPEASQGGRSYLPIAYDRIVVRDALPARFHSHVRNRDGAGGSEITSYDISLLDDDGRELVLIEGFSVRVVDVEAVHEDMGSTTGKPTRRAGQRLGLARDEVMMEPELGLDLLWR